MSDLLSLHQPDSDPLDQLALTTEEASSDMIVLQQSDGMNVVQNLDLNINEEELLEGLPQELRDSVQAMLEDQLRPCMYCTFYTYIFHNSMN